MAYQSKYTGLQIDDILDSVEWKQGKIEDLASIRAGAAKGATALQSYTEKYTGTVTGIKINGVVKSGSGVIDLGTISTDISGKQDKLVDGVNIATINGQSLTEGGDLTIEGGAKVYNWVLQEDGSDHVTGTLTKEEIENIRDCDILIFNGIPAMKIVFGNLIIITITHSVSGDGFEVDNYSIMINIDSYAYLLDVQRAIIPTQTSQLENDSNFVSSDGLKTINGESIVGSGDITIEGGSSELVEAFTVRASQFQSKDYDYVNLYLDRYGFSYVEDDAGRGGRIDFTYAGDGTKFLANDGTYKAISGGSSSGGSGAYAELNHGTSDTEFELTPNTFHVWDEVSALTLTLGSETSGVANEFVFQFTSGSEPTTLTLPDSIKWVNDSAPIIEPNMIYQISILKGLASCLEFSNVQLVLINFTIDGIQYQAEEGMSWNIWCNSQYNTDNFDIDGGWIWKGSRYYIQLNSVPESPTNTIIDGTSYELIDDWD